MKKFTPLVLLFFLMTISIIKAQTLDSIPYDHGHLFYRSYGNGASILLLSGGPGNNALQLEKVALKLAENNHIILLEQRGTGLSTPQIVNETTINLTSALDDINAVLNHLKLTEVILVGHSYGASLSTLFASKYPEKVKSTILISPGFFDYDAAFLTLTNISSRLGIKEVQRWEALLNKQSKHTESEKAEYKYLNRLAYIYDKSKIDILLPSMEGNTNQKTANLINMELLNYGFDLPKELSKITSPVHIISGRQDILSFMAYEYKIAKPSIQIHWIDQTGHFPMYEDPNTFYSILNKVLKSNLE